MTVMCTTRCERRLIGIRCQKGFVESKLDGQTDLHSDYSAHLRSRAKFRYQDFKIIIIVVMDNFDLQYSLI